MDADEVPAKIAREARVSLSPHRYRYRKTARRLRGRYTLCAMLKALLTGLVVRTTSFY